MDAILATLLAYLPAYGLMASIYVSVMACSLGGILTVQILGCHHLQKLFQALAVVWTTVEA
jgi:hypothetical protein